MPTGPCKGRDHDKNAFAFAETQLNVGSKMFEEYEHHLQGRTCELWTQFIPIFHV